MKKLFSAIAIAMLMVASAQADLISEFEPNPAGTDPMTTDIELSGTPGAGYSGFLTFVDTDSGGALGGVNNSVVAVSGTYDGNGLAVETLMFDAENPSYMLVFSSADPMDTDVDDDDDGNLDDPSVFGTVFDAVAIIDSLGDSRNYATQLGGVEFSTANEFEIAFRDASTGQFFGVDTFTNEIFDVAGNVFGVANFSPDPTSTTFGSINPTFAIPEPSSIAILAAASLIAVRRRR